MPWWITRATGTPGTTWASEAATMMAERDMRP